MSERAGSPSRAAQLTWRPSSGPGQRGKPGLLLPGRPHPREGRRLSTLQGKTPEHTSICCYQRTFQFQRADDLHKSTEGIWCETVINSTPTCSLLLSRSLSHTRARARLAGGSANSLPIRHMLEACPQSARRRAKPRGGGQGSGPGGGSRFGGAAGTPLPKPPTILLAQGGRAGCRFWSWRKKAGGRGSEGAVGTRRSLWYPHHGGPSPAGGHTSAWVSAHGVAAEREWGC